MPKSRPLVSLPWLAALVAAGLLLLGVALLPDQPVTAEEAPWALLQPSPTPTIRFEKTDQTDPVCPAWRIRYLLTITNHSGQSMTGIVVTDTIPTQWVTFYWCDPMYSSIPITGTYVWNLPDLPSGGQATIQLWLDTSAGTPSGTVVTNTAEMYSVQTGTLSDWEETTIQITAQCIATPTPSPTPTATATPTPTSTPTATPTETVAPGDLILSGLVYNAAIGESAPIPGAHILVLMCVPHTFETYAGPDGTYGLLIPANYANACAEVSIMVTADGYQPFGGAFLVADLRANPIRNFGLWPLPTPTPTATATPYMLYLPIIIKNGRP